jgi:hypothetical protein
MMRKYYVETGSYRLIVFAKDSLSAAKDLINRIVVKYGPLSMELAGITIGVSQIGFMEDAARRLAKRGKTDFDKKFEQDMKLSDMLRYKQRKVIQSMAQYTGQSVDDIMFVTAQVLNSMVR